MNSLFEFLEYVPPPANGGILTHSHFRLQLDDILEFSFGTVETLPDSWHVVDDTPRVVAGTSIVAVLTSNVTYSYEIDRNAYPNAGEMMLILDGENTALLSDYYGDHQEFRYVVYKSFVLDEFPMTPLANTWVEIDLTKQSVNHIRGNILSPCYFTIPYVEPADESSDRMLWYPSPYVWWTDKEMRAQSKEWYYCCCWLFRHFPRELVYRIHEFVMVGTPHGTRRGTRDSVGS